MEVPLEVYRIDVVHLAKEEACPVKKRAEPQDERHLKRKQTKWAEQDCAGSPQKRQCRNTAFKYCQGNRLKGLGGIRPAAGRYIHPLLGVSREEIEKFLKKKPAFLLYGCHKL